MQIPTEWEEAYPDERTLRGTILHEPLSALDLRKPICVSPETRTLEAIRIMNEQRIGAVLVTTSADRVVGIFTERDVLKKLVGTGVSLERPVREMMTPEPCCLHRHDAIVFALKLMHEGGFRHVPIVDDEGHPFAVVSVKDVVEFVVELFARELMTAPPASSHLAPTTSEGA
jgi:CBS domain-containing protein